VIWRDHGIEFTAHRSHKNRISRKRPVNSGSARRGLEKFGVFAAEPSAIAGVWIESAQRYSRRRNSEPRLQSVARDARGLDDGSCAQILRHAAKRDMGCREHHAKLLGGKHHRDARPGESSEHLGVTGEIVTARVQRSLVDGSGHNSFDVSRLRHLNGTLDRQPTELARQ